jgi:hypothetical protein
MLNLGIEIMLIRNISMYKGLKLHVTWVYEMGQPDLIYSKPFAKFYSIDMPRITT